MPLMPAPMIAMFLLIISERDKIMILKFTQ
jgi:hypothetical protein